MKNNFIFTSESVTEGHPDKVADQIESDQILDEFLKVERPNKIKLLVLARFVVVALKTGA